jgi:hypothetical protein
MIPFRQSCTGDLVVGAAFQPRFAVAPAVQIAAGKPLPQSVNALFKSLKPVEFYLILVYARRLLAGIIYITVRQVF